MGLQRRTFLSLLTGFGGVVFSAARAFGWPLSWKNSAHGDEMEPVGQTRATGIGNRSGIKITTIRRRTLRDSAQDLSQDPQIFYAQGQWRRLEFPRAYSEQAKADGSSQRLYGPRIATIVRPDLAKMFELNLDGSEYVVSPYPPKKKLRPLTKEQMEELGIKIPPPAETMKPTFQIETKTRDTGERKEIFGYLARHVITERKETPLEGSRRSAQEVITDAWYIDLEPGFYPTLYPPDPPDDKSPQRRRVHSYVSVRSYGKGEPPERPEIPEFIDIGEEETGFPVEERRISRSNYTLGDGSTRQAEENCETLVRLEKGTYDPLLFEIPSSFRRVAYIKRNPT